MENGYDRRYAEALRKASARLKDLQDENAALKRRGPVAVVGMACRFPGGADTPARLWSLLAEGRDAVGPVPPARWDRDRWWHPDPDAPGRCYVRDGAFLDDVAGFDPGFFNITPREAVAIDPQQRLLLETSWEAFEDAGCDPRSIAGCRGGVFVGLANYDYIQAHIHSGDAARIDAYSGSGVMFSTAAGRLAYVYDLNGPCLTVDTACSSSLVAIDLAIKALRRGDCDLALAGGVSLMLSPDAMVALCKVKALAADGRSRAFDDAASGYGRGEGCGLLVLKRLDDAVRDGDRIHAVLAGSAVNHDGRSNGLTAPSGPAQRAVIRAALDDAAIDPAAVGYVEAHGTGTRLGDPIEVNALGAVFGPRPADDKLLVGSVKSNIGHTEAAAGVAGVIKAILAIRHRQVPASLHVATLNRHVDWSTLPVAVATGSRPWPAARPAAGISAFGLSGTNAHVVVTPPPPPERSDPAAPPIPFLLLSAPDGTALQALAGLWQERLAAAAPGEVDALLWTAARRTAFDRRRVVHGRDAAALTAGLEGCDAAPSADLAPPLAAAADRWLAGEAVDWPGLLAGPGRRLTDAPFYPFQRQPLWLPVGPVRPADPASLEDHPPSKADQMDGSTDRRSILSDIQARLAEIGGLDPAAVDPGRSFLDLGLDSLMLVKLGQGIERDYGIALRLSQLFEELSTPQAVATHLGRHGIVPAASTAADPVRPAPPPEPPAVPPEVVGSLHHQQLLVMAQVAAQTLSSVTELVRLQLGTAPADTPAVPIQPAPRPVAPPRPVSAPRAASNFRGINRSPAALDAGQQDFVQAVVRDHAERTAGSKALVEQSRDVLADWKNTLSFWGQLKEAKYTIVGARFDGPRMWDVDGNAYVDIAMGMGVHGFGHKPAALHDALAAEMAAGLGLGAQTALAADCARLIRDLTGCARVAFTNTGTEAVMVALRLARAATGRNRIALFRHAYHGIFDGVLAADLDGETVPVGPGTPPAMIGDVLLLDYGSEAALELVASQGDSLAAVLVEPVQSRHPDLQPQRFLAELRRITAAAGAALIFDEMITGFRIDPGGAQAWFGVRADMALYGKIVGGGLPIGVIAGTPRFLDHIDGGPWCYGDRSGPRVPMIFFGGTFGRNPATMATARAALTLMKTAGPALQAGACAATTAFCDRLNAWFEREGVPLRAEHFATQWRLVTPGDADAQPIELELLYLLMMKRGVYTWERRICFFSTVHGPAEIDQVFAAITDSIAELRAGGFAWAVDSYPAPQFRPLTSVERRLYALAQFPSGELAYHLPLAFRVDGPLDPDRLEEAWRRVVARHEALRTSFVEIDGEPMAKRWAEPRFTIDRQDAPDADEAALLAGFVRPFDLAVAPLLRVTLVRLGPERHLLMADIHHLVADGLSATIIGRDLVTAYEGALPASPAGDPARCRALAAAGGEGARGAANAAFWSGILAAPLPRLDLPTDRSRGPVQAFDGDTVIVALPAATVVGLKALGRQGGTALYGVLLAAWSAFLHRLTGAEDMVVGGAVAGRDHPELAAAVGMYVNTIAFRLSALGDSPFRDHLAAVGRVARGAYDHQDYPFEAMAALDTARPANRNPLFDTILSYEDGSGRAVRTGDLTFTQRDVATPGAMVDLLLETVEQADGLTLRFSYAAALFDRATIDRWAAGFCRLLDGILADPARPIGRLPLLSDAEAALIARVNATAAAYPRTSGLLDLFAASAARHPDRPALVCSDAVLDYRTLDVRSSALACRLAVRVPPAARVGLFLDRSEWAVIAMLAVLKAGGAYVPLDPDYPADAVEYMIDDAGCPAVVTTVALAGRLPARHRGLAVAVDGDDAVDGDAAPLPPPAPEARAPEAHAYVIYTSGSTGRPKGCLVSHRNVVRLLINDRFDFAFGPDDVWLCAHSFSFDFSVWEIWGALAYGGQVVIAGRDDMRDPARLLALVRQHRITVLNQTPGAFYGLAAAEDGAVVHDLDRHLHTVIFGGDRLEPAHLRPWAARYGVDRPALINMYGITETTVHVSYHRVTAAEVFGADGASVIGRPLPETTITVLSPLGEVQGIGIAGEIHVGGSGVCDGYLNRPDLTAERFVERDGRRVYRTGDLGRLRADGSFDYLGRNDHQVQIRGHRVELGAIEHALMDHDGVVRAAVTDSVGTAGGQELVAYLVGDRTLTVRALRAHLAARLPDYMIPHHFVVVERLPLTANGKLDRAALPPPGPDRLATGTAFVAPRGAVAQAVAGVWAAVLGMEQVGAEDDFFALGGDSIKALQIVSRLRRAGITVSVSQIFTARTVAALAAADEGPLPDRQSAAAESAGLTPIQDWLIGDLGADADHFNNAVLLDSVETIDVTALQQAVDRLVAHHDGLRLALDRATQPPCQRIADTLAVPVEIVTVADAAALTAHAAALHRCFDVTRPPLLRVVVYRLPAGERLLLLAHHLVVDGLSWRILLEDLSEAYQAVRTGVPVCLPAVGTAWLDWVTCARTWAAEAADHAGDLAHWRAVDALAVPELPPDFDHPADTMACAESARLDLDAAQTAALLTARPNAAGVPADAVLLALVCHAVRACFGIARLRLRLEGHGREEIAPGLDLSRTVGWFTTLFPLVLDLTGASTPEDALHRAAEALGQVPCRGIGYGLLRQAGHDPALTGFGRQSEIGFNYLGRFDDEGDGPFRFAGEATGPAMGPGIPRQVVFDIEAAVVNGCLTLSVGYNGQRYARATIDRLIAALAAAAADFAGPRLPPSLCDRLGVTAAEVEAVLPLSPLQEGLYFHALSDAGDAYLQQFAFRLNGPLDPELYAAAWQAVAARHPSLRAAVVGLDDGRPVQAVLRHRAVPVQVMDVTALDPAAQDARFAVVLAEDRARGFDLAAEPLLRITLLRRAADSFDVLWSDHHIIVDGWSMTILQAELAAIYDALAAGRAPVLPPAPSYARHLDWLAARDRAAGLRHWRGVLADAPPPSTLPGLDPAPTDPPRPAEHAFHLGHGRSAALAALAGRLGVTLNSLVQGLWAVLLAAYNGCDDVIFGAVVSGRPPDLDGVESMVGLFLQTVPVRLRLDRQAGFAALCRAVQHQAAENAPFHHVALAELQRIDGPRRPLFNHVLVFENYPLDRGGGRFAVDQVRVVEHMHYDVSLMIDPGDDLLATFTFNEAAVEAATFARIEAQFRRLADAALADPEAPLATLDLSDTPIEALAGAAVPDDTVLDRFALRVATRPEAVAIEAEGVAVSYGALDRRATALARRLAALGVGPGTPVALALDPGVDLVAAMLGVMKAGGVFAPVDRAQPARRLAAVLARLQPLVVVGNTRTAPGLGALTDGATLVLWAPDGTVDGDAADPARPVGPADPAYVVFTSGTTGEPKAIVGGHDALCHFIAWEQEAVAAGPGLRVANLAPPTFDVSLRDLFLPLTAGGTVCVPDPALRGDGAALGRWLAAAGIALVHAVPSLFRQVLEALDRDGQGLPALRHLLFAGEMLRGADVARVRAVLGKAVAIRNLYGPSETTLAKCCLVLGAGPVEGPRAVPVGQPLPGVRVAVMKDGRPVPDGAIGEIWIAPPYRPLGYFRDPERMAAAFVEAPPTLGGAGVFYRSGDLGRRLADGAIEICGRQDGQVKVNGIRVELGEIETAVLGHEDVAQAAVLAVPRADGDLALVCYYTETQALAVEDLRARLALDLPAGMIPAFFLRLERFPLGLNGKIDRRALPRPEELAGRIRHVAPAGAAETRIAAIWAEVLGLPRVGVETPFFAIGGDSLRAIRVLARINQAFDSRITIAGFFARPTVRALADAVAGPVRPAAGTIPVLPPAADYPLSHAQRRLWVLDQMGGHPAAYSLPAAYRLDGPLDADALAAAVSALVARHEILRTVFVTVDGAPRQKVLDDSGFRFERRDLSGEAEPLRAALALARSHAEQRFDLARGPLFVAGLLRLAPELHVLLVNVHHIVADAWSVGVMIDDIARMMAGAALPPLRLHYKDYAAWEREVLAAPAAAAQRSWWHRQLTPLPERPDLPTDRPPPTVPSLRGARVIRSLDAASVAALRDLAGAAGTSPLAGLLAVLATLLGRLGGQRDVIIGMPVAARDQAELDDQVGFYVNTVPLRPGLAAGDTLTVALAKIMAVLTDALDHRAYPFDRLVDELDPPRDASRPPLFDVMAVYDESGRRLPRIDGVRVSEFAPGPGIAKFPLTAEFVAAPEGLRVEFEYATDLFDADRIERLADQFQRLLAAAVAAPEVALDSLDSVGAEERVLLLGAGPALDLPDGATIGALFETAAATDPDHPAVICEDIVIGYGALAARARRLASALVAGGLAPGEVVGVPMPRCADLPVAFLGIVLAGGAYLPLDPAHPAERLRGIAAAAGLRRLVTAGEQAGSLAAGLEVVDLTALGEDTVATLPAIGPDDVAYVIFTSGSTGDPKGVRLGHRGAVNLALAQRRDLGIGRHHRVLQFAPPGFDASIWEMVMALLSGATLVVAPAERVADPALLAAYMKIHKVTVATLPPAYLAELPDHALDGLELLVTAGEAPAAARARVLARRLAYVNAYGPTETTVCASWYRVTPDDEGPIPIGRAIANMAMLVLDGEGRLCPVGVPGEIHIGGVGLALDYLGAPELTAAAFVSHPFVAGARLYRTGDRGVVAADGAVVFLGRRDRQIKLRGHRVELDEIERVLARQAGVVQAAVLCRQDDGDSELVAYVAARAPVAPDDLRRTLAWTLPDYMIPARWVMCEVLPLTASGKVDRSALPAPEMAVAGDAVAATPLEGRIARIWREVLRCGAVGRDQRFFALGGDSIKAIQVVGRLRQAGYRIEMRDFLAAATVAALATRLADQDAWEAGDDGETEPPAALAPADYQGLFGAE